MTEVVTEATGGMKGDGGKRKWELVDYEFLDRFVDVVTFGANKYEAENWKKVSRCRYEAAMQRHLSAYLQGEKLDSETGITHLAHISCTAMFLNWFDKQGG